MTVLLRRILFCTAATLAAFAVFVGALTADEPSTPAADKPAAEKTPAKANPYIPRKGKSVEDLQAYIEQMQEAPVSIRSRAGFAEGMAVASERILETNPQGSLRTFVVISLLDAVHQWADNEENKDAKEADARLAELIKKYGEDPDKKISSLAALYALEARVLKVDDLELEKVPALLDEVKAALKDNTLDAKHLRLASATVHAINRLKDDAEATKRLKEFGELFAASSAPELSRYGKRMGQASEGAAEAGAEFKDWIGKSMELTGTTAEGAKFDVAQYKGKVVVVDFWATWCGPCMALMPELKETYEKYHGKGLEVVGVDLDRDLSALTEFLDKEKIAWVNLVPEEKEGQLAYPMAEKYAIRAIPTTFLVGRDGKIAMVNHGQGLTKEIEKLLAAKEPGEKTDEAKPAAESK